MLLLATAIEATLIWKNGRARRILAGILYAAPAATERVVAAHTPHQSRSNSGRMSVLAIAASSSRAHRRKPPLLTAADRYTSIFLGLGILRAVLLQLPGESTSSSHRSVVATAIDAEVSLMLAVATGISSDSTLQIVAAVAAAVAIAAFAATAFTAKHVLLRRIGRITGLALLIAAEGLTSPVFRVRSRSPPPPLCRWTHRRAGCRRRHGVLVYTTAD